MGKGEHAHACTHARTHTRTHTFSELGKTLIVYYIDNTYLKLYIAFCLWWKSFVVHWHQLNFYCNVPTVHELLMELLRSKLYTSADFTSIRNNDHPFLYPLLENNDKVECVHMRRGIMGQVLKYISAVSCVCYKEKIVYSI